MGEFCRRILEFVKDMDEDTKKRNEEKEWPHETISEAVLSSAGLAAFSFSVLLLCGHGDGCALWVLLLPPRLRMAPRQCPEKWQTCHS